MLIEINTRYLNKDLVNRFGKVQGKVMNSYQEVLRSSPINFSKSEYLPKIYVIPFVRKVVLKEAEIFIFNEVYIDPLEEKYWAFFLSLPFLEVVDKKFVSAILAHELAHLIDFAQHPSRIAESWEKHRGSVRLTHQELDQNAREYYRHFKEPVKTWLYELDAESNKIMEQVIKSGAEVREFKDYIQEFPQYLKSIIQLNQN